MSKNSNIGQWQGDAGRDLGYYLKKVFGPFE